MGRKSREEEKEENLGRRKTEEDLERRKKSREADMEQGGMKEKGGEGRGIVADRREKEEKVLK